MNPSAHSTVKSSSPATGQPLQFVGWLVGERVIRSLITAAVLAAVARHLQPSGFGVLNLALAAVTVAMPLAQFGLENILVRELMRRPDEAGAILGTSAGIRVIAGSLCVIVLQFAALLPALAPARGAIAITGLLLLVQAGEVIDAWYRRHVQSRTAVVARSAALIIGALIKLALIAADAGVLAFATVQVIESILFVAGLKLGYRHADTCGPRWIWDRKVAARLWREGRSFAIAAWLGALAMRIDQFAVSTSLGEAQVGQYFAALRLIELPFFVATAVAASLFPALVAVANPMGLRRSFAVTTALGLLTALGATIGAPWFVPAFFGREYAAAVPVLVIHGWACVPLFTGIVRAQWLAIKGAAGTQLLAAVSTILVQSALAIWLVPRFGLVGAATGFLLTQIAGAWLVPLALPALRSCLAPQLAAFADPFRPSFWRSVSSVNGQT